MSVTAVPLREITKGSVAKLWIGIAALALAGGGVAWAGQAGVRDRFGTAEQFLAANAGRAGVVTTPSGLQMKTLKPGTGPSPQEGEVALVGYKGMLRDGTVFDANEQAPFPVGSTVPGFDEALKRMKAGGEYEIWIPPALGYGDEDKSDPRTGQVVIPAKSVLHFIVTLHRVISRQEVEAMQRSMGAAGPDGAGPPPPGAEPQ